MSCSVRTAGPILPPRAGRLALLVVVSGFLAAAPSSAGEPPKPFADKNGWFGIQLDPNPLPEGGLRVQSVVQGGPAQKGGLQDGDVILSIEGEKVDSLQTLQRLISGTDPGTTVPVEIKRENASLTIQVTVGSRRQALTHMIDGGREEFLPNDRLHPEWAGKNDAFAAWFEETLRRYERTAIYQDLIAAFARDDEYLSGFYKLNEVAYLRREPLKVPVSSRALTDGFAAAFARADGRLPALVARAAAALDAPLPSDAFRPAADPRSVLDGLAFARGLVDRAFAKFSGGERAFLFRQSAWMAGQFREAIYLEEMTSQAMLRDNLEALRLSKRIDYTLLFKAGETAAAVAEAARAIPMAAWAAPDAIEGVRADGVASGDVVGAWRTAAGIVVIGGPGRTVYAGDAALIVDYGGDDVYLNNAGASTKAFPVSVLADLGGNDTYRGAAACQGTGRLGAGVLADFGGDDVYDAASLAQGCGLFGVGVLFDAEGNDRYAAEAYQCGAALFGIGILADGGGDDDHAANLYSQGFAGPKGLGLLLDAAGNDIYYATGRKPSAYGMPGVFLGMSQGFGIGFRQIAEGGIGTLLDLGGNDHYVAGEFSQGGAYFVALGILRDVSGDDRYDGTRYNQGFGVHSACGILMDDEGNDRYHCEVAANQGSAWDLGAGWLVDGAGDDRYDCHGLAQGGSSMNGFSVLLDLGGHDEYRARDSCQGFGGSTEYGGGRGALNLGILVDAGGGKDSYDRDGRLNGRFEMDSTGGVFADLPGSLEEALKALTEGAGAGEGRK